MRRKIGPGHNAAIYTVVIPIRVLPLDSQRIQQRDANVSQPAKTRMSPTDTAEDTVIKRVGNTHLKNPAAQSNQFVLDEQIDSKDSNERI